jgi:hypothetical protein
MQTAKKNMVQDHVHAFLSTMEILILSADQNVPKTLIVIDPKPASMKSVEILVQGFAGITHYAMLWIILLVANACKVLQEIQWLAVEFLLKVIFYLEAI